MLVVETVHALRQAVTEWRTQQSKIAFVPTMGNLHAGHLALVQAAQHKADKVAVSIFVNPMQFGKGEDFENYPRTLADDKVLLESIGADLLLTPAIDEVYSTGAKTVISVQELAESHCGRFRPGHFDGVATVVCKLFNMVRPDCAFFGLKDYQQFAVIKTMVRDLNFDIELYGIETVREGSGLALSSRNGYLSEAEKRIAPKLYECLLQAKASVISAAFSYAEIERLSITFLTKAGFAPEYFSICQAEDLKAAQVEDNDLVILAAAKLGRTRLIDNIAFRKR